MTSLHGSSKDPSWDKVDSAFYAAIEPNTGILCACIITLSSFFRRHLPFVGPWLDGLGQRHRSLNSWNSSTAQQPNMAEASDELEFATEVELPRVKDSSVVKTQSISTHDST
jgi:hypothetical protein